MNKKFIIVSFVVIGLFLVSSYLVVAPRGAEAQQQGWLDGLVERFRGEDKFPNLEQWQKDCFKDLEDWSEGVIPEGDISAFDEEELTKDVYNCIKDILLAIGFLPEIKPWPHDIKPVNVMFFQHFYNVNYGKIYGIILEKNGRIDGPTIKALKTWKNAIEGGEVPPGTPVMTQKQRDCFGSLAIAAISPYECLALILSSIEKGTDWSFPIFDSNWTTDASYDLDNANLEQAYLFEKLADFIEWYNANYGASLTVDDLFVIDADTGINVLSSVYQLLAQNGFTYLTLDALEQVKIEAETPIDMCFNIEDIQTFVPIGLFQNEDGNCICDACLNIEGVQTFVPSFLTRDKEGDCDCKVGGTVTGPRPTTPGGALGTTPQEALQFLQ